MTLACPRSLMKPVFVVGMILGLVSAAAHAADQPSERDYIDAVLDGLVRQGVLTRDAAETIKADAAAAVAARAKTQVKPKEPVEAGFGTIKFDGLAQNWLMADTSADGKGATQSTFRMRRMELKLSGRINPRVDWTVMVDPTKQLAVNTTKDPATGALTSVTPRQSSTILQDMFINYKTGATQSVKIGQFKLPLSYEGLLSSSQLDTVERAQIIVKAKYGDIRDIGIEWDGSFPRGTWQVGAFNGQGEVQNTTDNNQQKCLAGRVVIKPSASLALGVYGLTGRSESPTVAGKAERLGFESVYRKGANQLRGEYIRGQDGVSRKAGWYLLGTHSLSDDWQLVARYDTFDPDRSVANNDQRDFLVGCTRFLTGNNAKVQLNYVHNHRDGGAGMSGDQVLVNAQIAF